MDRRHAVLVLVVLATGCSADQPNAQPAAAPVASPVAAPPAIAPPSLSTFTPSPIALPNIPAYEANVTAYGAVPDDGIDDTAAIQRGLDAVNAANGGTLVFPAGRYDIAIDPTRRRALTLYPRLRLLARPGAPATIRLGDGQPPYESVMATASYPTRLDDAEFVGMTFDANGLGNPVRDADETNGDAAGQAANPTLRYFIRSFAGSRVRIADATFLNADVGNTVSFNGAAISDVIVENSRFLDVGGALIDHDHSSVYFDGKRLRLAGNAFRSRHGAGTVGARTAIETHGDDVEVRDNVVDGFLQGVNVVGRVSNPSRQALVGNRFTNVAVGINIWPLADAIMGPAFVALIIRGNAIAIDAAPWWRSRAMVVGLAAGIHFEAAMARARLDSLDIIDNRIAFTAFPGERADADRVSVGIGVRGVENVLAVSSLAILRNTISNAIGPCILSTAIIGPAGASQIADNDLFDCARSGFLVGAGDTLRSGIAIGGTTANLAVTRNLVRASGAAPVTRTGILTGSTCTANCSATDNSVSGIDQPIANTGTGWRISP